MTRLKRLLKHLNPKKIIEQTEIPNDRARASVTLQSSTVRNYAEFERIIIAYVTHHMQIVFGNAPPPHFCLDKARKFLESSIGWDNAVYIAMSGAEGGMPHCLNQINVQFKQESKQNYFRYFLDQFIDPLNFSEVVEVMRELKEKIGEYSPESFRYIEPEALAANYKDVIWKYIDSISRYRNLWDY
jgi:hypothetical protein|tara:strand:- start:676 stop:1233 length:558 start_codon:yes stop_codon:yes gene_type:complete